MDMQLYLFQKATTQQRFHAMRSLSETVIRFSREAIRNANPNLSERESSIQFVAYHYGKELAENLSRYLDSQN